MKKRAIKKLHVSTETIVTLGNLASVRGGDSAEPTGSVDHHLCLSQGCPRTQAV